MTRFKQTYLLVLVWFIIFPLALAYVMTFGDTPIEPLDELVLSWFYPRTR